MAINQIPNLRTWVDGQPFSARDYIYERNFVINKLNEVVADFNELSTDVQALEALTDQAVLETSNVKFNSIDVTTTATIRGNTILGGALSTTSNITSLGNAAITGDLTVNDITSNDINANDITANDITANDVTIGGDTSIAGNTSLNNADVSGNLTVPFHNSVINTFTDIKANKVDKDLSNYSNISLGQGTGSLQDIYVDNNGNPSKVNIDALRNYIAEDFVSFGFVLAQADENGLPDIPESEIVNNKVYLVPLANPAGGDDIYTEYLYLTVPDPDPQAEAGDTISYWEFIGTTDVNLTNYYDKQEVLGLLGNAGGSEYTYYVDPDGDDDNPGTLLKPFKTIKKAAEVIADLDSIGTQSFPPYSPIYPYAAIKINSGDYYEQLPIVVPRNTALVGTDLRTVRIYPDSGLSDDGVTDNKNSTMFLMSASTLAINLAIYGMEGFTKPADLTEPDTVSTDGMGVGFALNPASPIYSSSPYILDCSFFSTNGGVAAYVDGDVHKLQNGTVLGNRSMLFYAYTVINDGGVGLWADNGGIIESVSNFTYYAAYGYLTTRGGYLRGLNGSNSWGDYALVAHGFLPDEQEITGELKGNVVEYSDLNGAINDGETLTGGTSGATATILTIQEGASKVYLERTSAEEFIDDEEVTGPTGSFTLVGNEQGQSGALLVVTNLSAEPEIRTSIQLDDDDDTFVVSTVSGTYIDTTSTLILTLAQEKTEPSPSETNIQIRKRYSQVRVTGHDFLNVGTGGIASINVNGGTLINPGTPPVQSQQVGEFETGRVFAVSTDQDGNFRVGKYFAIDQGTGRATLDASAFDLSGLTSLRLGSIGAQIGESINEFSADPLLSQNSNQKVPTQAAIRTYVAAQIAAIDLNDIEGNTEIDGDLTVTGDTELEGDLTVTGNLTVQGTETILNTQTLEIEDKNIVLANVETPTDSTADGGGITLKGDTDKTLIYSEADERWESNIPIDATELTINGEAVAQTFIFETTLLASDWSGTDPVVLNQTGITGIKADDTPIVDIVLDISDFADWEAIEEAWSLVKKAETTTDDEMTFYAASAPTEDIPIKIKVIR